MYIPTPRYCSPCSWWGWKNNFGAPRGVRAWRWRWPPAPSCQRETRRGKGANFIPTAANRGVAFLFGHSPVSVPFDQFLLPHRHRRPLLLSPSPFFSFRRGCPGVPPPRSARVLRAAGPKVREAEENPGDRNSGQNVLGEKAKSCAQPGREGGGVFCVPAQTPACGEGFLPLPQVWAAGLGLETARGEEGDRRLRRGRPATCVADTQPTRVALRRRRKNAHACGRRTFLQCRQNTLPGCKDGGGGASLIIISFLTYTLCQKHLRVVQIYHS